MAPLALLGLSLIAATVLWTATHAEPWLWVALGVAAAVSVSGST